MTATGSHWLPIARHWAEVEAHEKELGLPNYSTRLLALAYEALACTDVERRDETLRKLIAHAEDWYENGL